MSSWAFDRLQQEMKRHLNSHQPNMRQNCLQQKYCIVDCFYSMIYTLLVGTAKCQDWPGSRVHKADSVSSQSCEVINPNKAAARHTSVWSEGTLIAVMWGCSIQLTYHASYSIVDLQSTSSGMSCDFWVVVGRRKGKKQLLACTFLICTVCMGAIQKNKVLCRY